MVRSIWSGGSLEVSTARLGAHADTYISVKMTLDLEFEDNLSHQNEASPRYS
jgi:hypothetical protein